MHDVIARIRPDELIGLTAVVGTILVALTWVVAYYWRKVRQVEAETALKNELVQRGLSVADIERVMRSGKQRAGIFDSGAALEGRLRQVSNLSGGIRQRR